MIYLKVTQFLELFMGWWGQRCYGKPSMGEVRKYIEEDTGLTVKSLKFGYAVCVEDKDAQDRAIAKGRQVNPDYLNFICIALWQYRNDNLMIKQIEETMSPAKTDVSLKYANAICKATKNNEWATKWRQKVRDYHIKRNAEAKLARSFQAGDRFFVFGQSYRFIRKAIRGKNCVLAENIDENGKLYRIKPWQIDMTRVPLLERC